MVVHIVQNPFYSMFFTALLVWRREGLGFRVWGLGFGGVALGVLGLRVAWVCPHSPNVREFSCLV